MTTINKTSGGVDPVRTKLISGVHAAAKAKGVSDDDRRVMMLRLVGKSSTKDMTAAELERVLAAINGHRETFPWRLKVRALWISAAQLGLLRDASDAALDAFVAKQSRVTALRFLPADQAEPVIEALKAWLARPREKGGGGVQWGRAGASDQQAVAYALWALLMEKKAVTPSLAACAPYCRAMLGITKVRPLTPQEWGRALPKLAVKVRKGAEAL